ncbi:unnamed protein product, partial [Ectocarpus sp. 12 AP-2014]
STCLLASLSSHQAPLAADSSTFATRVTSVDQESTRLFYRQG